MRRRVAFFTISTLALAGCIGPQDKPSNVHDLRVLGVKLEPPELMTSGCSFQTLPALPAQFLSNPSSLQYTALIADPAGAGRPIHYELFACASQDDNTCSKPDEQVPLAQGDVAPAAPQTWMELSLQIAPENAVTQDGAPLLQRVLADDANHGLGGLRMPLALHLSAGAEEIWAGKLMVFSCAFFPQSAPNANPVLPGMMFDQDAWGPGDMHLATGAGPFNISFLDFADREESYVVASYTGTPIALKESWQISWYTDHGGFSPETSGGVDLGGQEGRPLTQWTPDVPATEQDVQFWFVARDGRGGESWVTRTARDLR